MKILLIDPPWIKSNMGKKNLWKSLGSCLPSLGLAYIAATLEKAKHNVGYLDCTAEQIPLDAIKDYLSSTYRGIEFVGITATTPLVKNAWEIAKVCKEIYPDCKVVMGGVHPTVMPDESLNLPYVDYVVRDEGEETMLELVSGKEPKDILGLSYKQDGKIIHNLERPLIHNLDSIPIPAYHLLPLKKYHPSVGNYKRLPAMSIFATRGCPGRCTFCHRAFRGMVRKRSAESIYGEIYTLRYKYGFKEISFYDDTFTVFKDEIAKLCKLLVQNKVDVTWSCFTRVDYVNKGLLTLMKRAGCHLILFGVESADETILKNINKKINLDKVKQVVIEARQIGIETRASFMFGNVGETEETMQKTLDFAIKLDPDEVQFNITTAYPGTELYNWADKQGLILTKDWDRYGMSDIVLKIPTTDRETIEKYYHMAHKKFYLRPKVVLRRLMRINSFTQLMQEVKGGLAVIGL